MIALTTPTGNIGSKVLAALLQTDAPGIRVLARHPDKLPTNVRNRIEIVEGSMDDPVALDRLMDQADALFWCQPDTPKAVNYVGAYEELARLGAEAIRTGGVARVVAISAAGEPGAIPAGPITALHRMESILAETGAAMRFLRCGSFFENLLWQWDQILEHGSFTYPAPGDVPGPQVATTDIARVATDWLESAEWSGRECIPLIGPEDLTYDEMAAALAEALGRTVRYEPARAEDYRKVMISLGHNASATEALIDMFRYLAENYAAPANVARTLTPTTLADWLNR